MNCERISKIDDLLAKSDGTKLLKHSVDVSSLSAKILGLSTPYIKKYEDIIKISSLLHDIGKCCKHFQQLLNGKKGKKVSYLHNEIGWAFLINYLDHKDFDTIANNVYWHHGIINRMGVDNANKILDSIEEGDVELMKQFIIEILGDVFLIEESRCSYKRTPTYYINDDDLQSNVNVLNLLYRGCLISADRMVSSNVEIDNISKLYSKEILNYDVSKYDKNRIDCQLGIVSKLNDSKTSIVNAPAGFGKTLVGLLWSLKRNKKLVWVCPRNIIAESMYDSIIKELKSLGIDLKIELYLTGERVKSNHNDEKDFSSDIIITNIDNFLRPTVDNSYSDRLFFINTCDVVFDEYHELLSDAALFSCFVNIMRLRNRFSNSNTVLLSATSIKISFLWNSLGCETTTLPNDKEHYPAAHNKPYKFNVKEISDIKEIEIDKETNNLIILNSISQAQNVKHKLDANLLVHSYFEKNVRDKQFETLISQYGKNGERPNGIVVGTHIIQASLDISFQNLYESVLSPEATGQRMGRDDRWGDYSDRVINCFKFNNMSENKAVGMLYSNELMNVWFNRLKKFDQKQLTLDEFYIEYNKHNIENENKLKRFITEKYLQSLSFLNLIYPIKHFGSKEDGIYTSGSNKLRTTTHEVFVIAEKFDKPNVFTEPFSEQVRNSYDEQFKEDGGTLTKILSKIKNINDLRYDYTETLNKKKYSTKGITIDEIRRNGKYSNTPYMRFDKVYHEEYGLINKQLLDKILNNK